MNQNQLYSIFVSSKNRIYMKALKWIALVMIFVTTFTLNTSAKGRRKDKAQLAYNQGHYEAALALWNKSIAKYERRHKENQCPFYTKAGMTALKLGKNDEARALFQKAIYSASVSPVAFVELARMYRKIDNLSLEIDALEKYVKRYPAGKDINPMRERLFATYVESENWEDALKLWDKLPRAYRDNVKNKAALLKVNAALENAETCNKLAVEILKSESKNITALDWEAKKYFWRAENRYKAEIKAYNENKTRRQYVELLKAFKVVTVNFKKSLTYFRKLYFLQPTSENALYLGNIYARLESQSKAKYYHYLANKLKKEGK